MRRDPVSSSTVAEVGYDPIGRILEVLFKSGAVYQYFDVPQQIYEELMRASSAGGFLNSNVKGQFRYARV
ncbi:KTSC domain-containing protein [Bradyrhizobium sp. ISRA443]|uniref:KTSC domain-containing protein n=1 Tax=unclassified Bradyrhizobium TaxID=2631580 RepID=UPI002479A3EF|nr:MULTISPECIES: KTSC domain-containing protein [unclassified Bradyrhizobium]WGR93654.1 KTSC domain-containing protein [Bradyrhizobium sp. ISRA435]WGR98228.1 KTSC domain-containing protein [Bradyrhizobium sp. ISRA436]WGS05117.1 KTSC domain-containing protein [Bradyrhizobium sp. ISRA437]WGS12002.1 KTSC domain-containing protein [Bradyrhizobium sp. ISRA443]